MGAETVGSVILWLIVLAILVVIAVYLLRWLYRRSTEGDRVRSDRVSAARKSSSAAAHSSFRSCTRSRRSA